MPINWGTLSGQNPVGGVVGNIAPRQSSLNSLAGGIMSGLQQGQQMQATAQEMQQRAAMFPGQQQLQNQAVESGQMDLDAKKQMVQTAASLREAAQKGEQQYGQVLLKTDPVAFYAFQKGKADYQEALSKIALINAETKTKSADVIANSAVAFSRIADAAHQADQNKPGSGAQVYKLLGAQLDPGTQKEMIKAGLGEWNNNTNVILHSAGLNAMADLQAKQEKTSQPEITKIQGERDKLQSRVDSGNATDAEKRNLDELNASIAAKGRGAAPNPLDAKLAETDAARVKAVQDVADKAPQVATRVDSALQILDRPGMESKVGPIIDITKLNQLSPDVQELGGVLNDLALTAKGLSGMPSNTFSEADRKFVQQIAGTTAFNIKSLRSTLNRMKNINMKQAVEQVYKMEDNIRKRSSGYKEWKDLNPGPDLTPFENKTSTQGTQKVLTYNPQTGKLE